MPQATQEQKDQFRVYLTLSNLDIAKNQFDAQFSHSNGGKGILMQGCDIDAFIQRHPFLKDADFAALLDRQVEVTSQFFQ